MAPGDGNRTGNLHGLRRLAMRCIPPGGSESISGVQCVGAWRWGADLPGGGWYVCVF